MTVLQRLIRNIATNWFGLLVNIVISFFLAPFVVNKLGSTYYGVWAITLQFTGYLHLMDFGVRDAIIRYASKYRAQKSPIRLNQIIRVALEIYFPVFLAALAFSAIGAWVFPFVFAVEAVPVHQVRLVVLIVGLSIAQTFIFNVFHGVLFGFQRFDIGNYIGIAIGLLRAALIVLALNSGHSIVGLSVAQMLVGLASGVLGLLFALNVMKAEGFHFRWVRLGHRRRLAWMRRMVGYSIYVFINNIGQKTSAASGAIIIGIFLPVAAVTPYAIAGSLANYVKSLMGATAWVFNPLVSHYAAVKDSASLSQVVCRGAKVPLVVGLPVTIAYFLIGDTFIGLWMGPQYVAEAAVVLMIFAFFETMSAPHHVMAAALYGLSKHQSLAYLRVAEAVANIVLSVALVKHMGIVGAALGALIPHLILVLILLPFQLGQIVGVRFRNLMAGIFVRPLLGAIPFGVCTKIMYDLSPPNSLTGFFLRIVAVLPVYGISVLFVSLDIYERRIAVARTAEFFSRKIGKDHAKKNSVS